MTPEQEKEYYDSLDPQAKWNYIFTYLTDLKQAVADRMKVLPQFAALSVAMLVIVSFGTDLMPLSSLELKIVLTILLSIVPLSFIVYSYDLGVAEKKNFEKINILLGFDLQKKSK